MKANKPRPDFLHDFYFRVRRFRRYDSYVRVTWCEFSWQAREHVATKFPGDEIFFVSIDFAKSMIENGIGFQLLRKPCSEDA